MNEMFSRTEMLFGTEAMNRLQHARVAVFGVGGVGGYVVEALVRSGVGAIDLIDPDRICPSNLNRQIIATTKNIGEYKVDAARKRIEEINPQAVVRTYKVFYLPDTASQFNFHDYDYVVDAIDTVTGKLQLIEAANDCGTAIISSMGAGNKVDPTAFSVADIYQTSVCPLAKVMRRELKKRGIKKLKVVYSKEPARTPLPIKKEPQTAAPANRNPLPSSSTDQGSGSAPRKKATPGSNAFVPSVAGLIIAGEVIKDLISSLPLHCPPSSIPSESDC